MKKGFTLIEMLGIIAVLGVVLLVTFPVMNKSLKQMKEDKNKNFIKNLKISAEAYAGLNKIATAKQITIQDLYDAELLKGQYYGLDTTSKISIEKNGTIATAVKIEDKCYIKEPETDEIIIQEYNVNTCYYKKIISEEITIAGEPFLVIDSNRDETKLIAKYNLYIGRNSDSSGNLINNISDTDDGYGRQNEKALGQVNTTDNRIATVKFSSTAYWGSGVGSTYPGSYTTTNYPYVYDSNSEIYDYIEDYKDLLNTSSNIVKSARLMSSQEGISLGCTFNINNSCPEWIRNTTFWLGSASGDTQLVVVYIGNGRMGTGNTYNATTNRGARPVIVVNTKDL